MSAGPNPAGHGELLSALAGAADEIGSFLAGLDSATFMEGNSEDWSPAHHLDHLIRSNLPVAGGLGVARGRLQPLPAEHQPRDYAVLRDEYHAALSSGAKAFGRWLPEPEGTQAEQIERYISSLNAVRNALDGWTDAELDAWAMPHPALGVLSVREMLLFTLLHNRHHADGVRSRLGKVERQAATGDNGPS